MARFDPPSRSTFEDPVTSRKSEYNDLFASMPNPFVMLWEMIKGAPLPIKILMALPVIIFLTVVVAVIVGVLAVLL